MPKLVIQTFGIALDARFPKPVAFSDAKLSEFAGKMADLFNLNSDQIRLRQFDTLYGYELSASFFNNTAKFERDADHLELSINEASNATHLNLIAEIIQQYSAAILAEVIPKVDLSISLHATFESEEKYTEFFRPFGRCPEVLTEGIVARLQVPTWTEPVRIVLDKSLAYENAMFIVFSSAMMLPTEKATLGKIAESVDESVRLFAIELAWA